MKLLKMWQSATGKVCVTVGNPHTHTTVCFISDLIYYCFGVTRIYFLLICNKHLNVIDVPYYGFREVPS